MQGPMCVGRTNGSWLGFLSDTRRAGESHGAFRWQARACASQAHASRRSLAPSLRSTNPPRLGLACSRRSCLFRRRCACIANPQHLRCAHANARRARSSSKPSGSTTARASRARILLCLRSCAVTRALAFRGWMRRRRNLRRYRSPPMWSSAAWRWRTGSTSCLRARPAAAAGCPSIGAWRC